jgi:hypothetical protein
MLLLAAAGTAKGAVPVPADPAATSIPAPSLTFVDSSLDALRLSTMTAYNPNKAMNAQLRLRRLPGAVELGTGSANAFPFTPGVWHLVKVTRQGARLSVEVTPQGQPRKGKAWSSTEVAGRRGQAIGFYLQECRDITLKDVRLLGRK